MTHNVTTWVTLGNPPAPGATKGPERVGLGNSELSSLKTESTGRGGPQGRARSPRKSRAKSDVRAARRDGPRQALEGVPDAGRDARSSFAGTHPRRARSSAGRPEGSVDEALIAGVPLPRVSAVALCGVCFTCFPFSSLELPENALPSPRLFKREVQTPPAPSGQPPWGQGAGNLASDDPPSPSSSVW